MFHSHSESENNQTDNHPINPAPAHEERVGTFSSLRFRNFRFLLGGTILSQAGGWIQTVTVSWLVYNLTGSGTLLGTMSVLSSVAALSMIPFAGLLIDRLSRRSLMMAITTCLFAITLTIGIVLISGHSHISYLFILAFLCGMINTVDSTLRQVIVFDIVPRAHTPNAVALIQTGWSLMRSFGPAVGGFLVVWFGPGGNFLCQAGAYALIALTITQIRFPPKTAEPKRTSAIKNIQEGLRYVTKQKVTRTFMIIGFVPSLLIIPILTIIVPIYAKDVLQGGANTLGILMAAIGVGGILGGIFIASIAREEHRGWLQMTGMFFLSLSLVGFAFCTSMWTAMIFLASAGFFEQVFGVTNQTLLQLSIPNNLRGRVTSVLNLSRAISPIGAMLAGAGSDFFHGPKTITIIMGLTAACVAVSFLIFSPTVRDYKLSQGIQSPD